MLRVLAACLSKQHEFYTRKKKNLYISCLGVKTETGHRIFFTCKPICIFPRKTENKLVKRASVLILKDLRKSGEKTGGEVGQ